MFRNLVKIANKLDSLGLMKEADILDRYLEKNAGILGYVANWDNWSPPGNLPSLMSKWLDYYTLDGGIFGAFAKTLPTTSLEGIDGAKAEIRAILELVKKCASDPKIRTSLVVWYSNNIEQCFTEEGCQYNIVTDLNDLADDIEAMSSHAAYNNMVYNRQTKEPVAKTADLYAPLILEIRQTAELWKGSFNEKDVAPPPETPGKPEGEGVAMVGGSAYPQSPPAGAKTPVAKPQGLTGWDKYMANTKYGPAVKKAWEDFVKTDPPQIGVDPRFSAFTSWYKERFNSDWGGQHKSPEEVIKLIGLHQRLIEKGDFTSPIV